MESSPCPTALKRSQYKHLTTKKLSGGTRKEYKSTVTKWTAWGNGVDVDQINRSHIRDFLDWVHDKAAEDGGSNPGRTANKARENLRAIMSWAWEQDYVAKLPRFPSPKPQRDVAGRHYLTKKDLNALYFATYQLPQLRGWKQAFHGWPLLASGTGRVLQLRSRYRDGVRVCWISRADILATCVMASGATKRSGQRVSVRLAVLPPCENQQAVSPSHEPRRSCAPEEHPAGIAPARRAGFRGRHLTAQQAVSAVVRLGGDQAKAGCGNRRRETLGSERSSEYCGDLLRRAHAGIVD